MSRQATVGGTTYKLACLYGPGMSPLVPLFRDTFRRRLFTIRWLQQKYAFECEGVRAFACAAFTDRGQPAAALGLLPWPVRFGERTELAAQLVDGATHHEHRRKGLFSLLGEMAVELCESVGVSFMFGFAEPQRHSYPGLIRHVGFSHIDDLTEYRSPVHTLWAERIARHAGPLHHLYERYVQRTFGAYGAEDGLLQNSLIHDGFAGTDRSPSFHAYKKFGGSRVLAVEGGRVWLKVKRGVLLGDFEAVTEADMERTMRVLEHVAGALGIHQILFQSSPGTRFSKFFDNRVHARPCLAVLYRNLRSQIPSDRLRFTFGDLDNF
jgi:hypothetical protein